MYLKKINGRMYAYKSIRKGDTITGQCLGSVDEAYNKMVETFTRGEELNPVWVKTNLQFIQAIRKHIQVHTSLKNIPPIIGEIEISRAIVAPDAVSALEYSMPEPQHSREASSPLSKARAIVPRTIVPRTIVPRTIVPRTIVPRTIVHCSFLGCREPRMKGKTMCEVHEDEDYRNQLEEWLRQQVNSRQPIEIDRVRQ